MLLSAVPETHGRSAAGVSATSSGHAPPTATIAAPPASSWRSATSRPRGATHSHAAAIAGHDHQRRRHLRLEAEPDHDARQHDPAQAPVLQARTTNHSAAAQHSISSASGLL